MFSSFRISHIMQNFACDPQKKKKNTNQLNVCLELQGYQVLHSFNNKVNFTSGDARVTRVRVHVTRKYCS